MTDQLRQAYTCLIFCLAISLTAQSSIAAGNDTKQIHEKFGECSVILNESGAIESIEIAGIKLLKRGLFFVKLGNYRDTQHNAIKQKKAQTTIERFEESTVIISKVFLKTNGNNLEYIQRITIYPEGEIDVHLKMRHMLKKKFHLQYELSFAAPEITHGKKAIAISDSGQMITGTMPINDFIQCELVSRYFDNMKNPHKLLIETDCGILSFELFNMKSRLFISKRGGMNWIMTPSVKLLPGQIFELHYKIGLKPPSPK